MTQKGFTVLYYGNKYAIPFMFPGNVLVYTPVVYGQPSEIFSNSVGLSNKQILKRHCK